MGLTRIINALTTHTAHTRRSDVCNAGNGRTFTACNVPYGDGLTHSWPYHVV